MGIWTIFVEAEPEATPYLRELPSAELRRFLRRCAAAFASVDATLSHAHPSSSSSSSSSEAAAAAEDSKTKGETPGQSVVPSARALLLEVLGSDGDGEEGFSGAALAMKTKFWEIAVSGSRTTVRYGAKGTPGTTLSKVHASSADAERFARDSVRKKTREGYRPQTQPLVTRLKKELLAAKPKGHDTEDVDDEDEEEPSAKRARKVDDDDAAAGETMPQLGTVLGMVLGFLSRPEDIASAGAVCREWHDASQSEVLWRDCFMLNWGPAAGASPAKLVRVEAAVQAGETTWRKASCEQARRCRVLRECRRADLDAAGEAVEWMLVRLGGAPMPKAEHLAEVAYGPAMLYTPQQVSEMHKRAKAITYDDVVQTYMNCPDIPDVLGGILCKPRRQEDADFVAWHMVTLKVILANAAQRGSALVWYLS